MYIYSVNAPSTNGPPWPNKYGTNHPKKHSITTEELALAAVGKI